MTTALGPHVSTDELATYLTDEIPGLQEYLQDKRWEPAAFAVRDWVSEQACFAGDEALILSHQGQAPQDILWQLQQRKGGVWCGGVAWLLAEILRVLAIPATTYMYGAGWLSHETTLVGLPDESGVTYYVLDAYLNFHYVDAETHALLPLKQLLRYVRAGEHGHIRRVDTQLRRTIVAREREWEFFSWLYPSGQAGETSTTAEGVVCYSGAECSVATLAKTGPFGALLDQVRGSVSQDQFLLDMMLVRPIFARMIMQSEFFPEVELYRNVIAGLADVPAWASQLAAGYRTWQ